MSEPSPTARPLIAITGRRWLGSTIAGMPDNFAGLSVDLHIGAFADAVQAAGGIAVLLPCSDAAIDALDRVDGLVMTGGSDVVTAHYGEEPHPAVYGVGPERDLIELALVTTALGRALPVLAVCRGMQLLNVALGGSLVQHRTRRSPASSSPERRLERPRCSPGPHGTTPARCAPLGT